MFPTTLPSTLILAARRVWNHRLLMACLLAGLIAAVALLSSIPLYADAVHHRLMQGELTEEGTYRPPFAFLWRYIGAWHGDIAWDAYAPIDEYLAQQAPAVVGLPLDIQVRHVRTTNLRLFPATETQTFAAREPLLWTSLGFVSGLADHVQLIEGEFPGDDASGADVEVLISQTLAEQVGLQVGERYVLFAQGRDAAQIPVRIAGVWRPLNAQDPFWFYQPSSFDEVLLTSEPAFTTGVLPKLEKPIDVAVWYQVFDGSRVRTPDVPRLLDGVKIVEARATALLNNTTLDASPVQALQTYSQAARLLTVVLTIFGMPVLMLVLYFIGQVAGMVVRRGQGEVALLRSRGATRAQVLFIHLLEFSLVGAIGLIVGLLLGAVLAQLMGQMRSFLDSSPGTSAGEAPLLIVLSWTALWYGLAGVGLAVLASLLPALAASRHTIITFKWEQARALRRPFWQRYFIDLLLSAVSLYGLFVLRGQQTIALVGQGDDPFSNPLLVLVPALFCFSLALLFMRVFPALMSGLAWLADRLPGMVVLLTLRQVARSAGQYIGPLLLLIVTLSLATFTASMAATLDGHLHDQVYYQVGADMNLAELGQSTESPDRPALPGEQPVTLARAEGEPRWLFLPVSEHLRVPGVKAAARAGDYQATSNIGGRQQSGRLLGVDWTDFTQVAFFRLDFAANDSLGGLMNQLALKRSHILVSRSFLARNNLSIGDPLRLTVNVEDVFEPVDFIVAAALDLFPTLYPQDGPFFVANLDYVHESLGETFPYDVWLSTDPSVRGEDIVAGVRDLGLAVVTVSDARATMTAEQMRPERQGPFGLLSVGFLAAAALTVLGFLVYAVVSFQRRFIELGMLRAVGLSVVQMAAFLAGEQITLVLVGVGIGTGLGVAASNVFIPFLQVGAGKTAQVPPFVVHIAWDKLWIIYAVFGAMFLVAV
ncbi:MAG TPA: FtsX-like permease family protein, partial [Anaerolineae bacterium]|nr:FtsX-like permease family protein [Anaerolineae bacterium]